MMTGTVTPGVVIVGSGLAGYTLAREFRKQDRQTPITVITRDGGEAYSKPMLSNALSQGKSPDALASKTASQVAADLDVQVMVQQHVAAIDRAARQLQLTDGTKVDYDRLVLAVGADPRPAGLAVPVATVNDLDDFRGWHAQLQTPRRVLLIGAGLVGSEFANDLTQAGHQVIMVDPAPWPLGRLLPQAVGQQLAAALAGIGVELHLNSTVSEMKPGEAVLSDGHTVAFDLALSAIGLVPRTQLAVQAGLTVDRGIVVDRLLATSDARIFALGDCAQSPAGPLPFVLPLMAQARALANTLAGMPTPLVLPALPVVVKTPCLPMAISPPAMGAAGEWNIEGEGPDLKALFVTPDGKKLGFALSGSFAAQRQTLAKEMPDILS